MPSLLLSPNTRTAFDAVRRHLREAQKEDALALAWLIMPSPLVPVWRRSAGASVNVHTLALGAAGPDAVVHAILERTGNPALVLDGFQRRLLLREILAQAHRHSELQVLPDPAEKPGVIRHLDNLLQELKRQTISPSAFQIYADTSDSAREQDIAFLFRSYEETLSQKGVLDETGAMAVACQELETGADPPLPLAYVGVVGYVAFTSLQIRLMQQLLPRARNACLLMPGTESSDSLRLAQDVAQALDLPFPCPAADIVATESPGPTYVEAPTLEHEVRHALRAVKRLHVEKRVAYSDVTLCLPEIDAYAPLLHAVAEEYGVPLELPKSLAQNPLWVFLRQLLHLFPDFFWPHCWDVFASPFLRQTFLSPDEIATVRFMTTRCRVLQGREQWRAALSPAVTWSRAEKKRWPLMEESIQDLAYKTERLLDALSPPARGSALDCVAWVERILWDTKEESIGLVVPPNLGTPEASQSEMALALMRQVAADLKSELSAQSALAWEDARAVLLDAMAACEISLYKPNRAVRVVLFDQGWALPTQHLFVLGLNEGSLPRALGVDPFYTPQERTRHPLGLERHDPVRSRVQWAQLQANCRTRITLSRSALTASAPSPFWDAGVDPIRIGRDELPDFSRAASRAELLLTLLHARAVSVPSVLQRAYAKAKQLARVTETRLAYAAPGPFEGVLEAPDILGVLRRQFGSGYVWSPTSLQDYARCPMGFFASRVLQLEAEEAAEPGLDRRDKGSILHEILHRLHQWLIEEQVALTPAHEDRILAEAIRISRAAWREAPLRFRFQPYSLSQFDLREIENLVAWCVRNEISEAATEPGWRPWRLEWRFTSLVEQGADCADEVFTLHGMVDRVDRNADGTLRVIDYKTRRNAYAASDLDSALANQTILYALAVSQQGWGSVRESGYRLLGRTEDARLQNAVDFRDTAEGKANILLALIRRQQARIRAGTFPNAPPKLEGQANRCVDRCSLSDFCQPSFVSRRKGQHLTD